MQNISHNLGFRSCQRLSFHRSFPHRILHYCRAPSAELVLRSRHPPRPIRRHRRPLRRLPPVTPAAEGWLISSS